MPFAIDREVRMAEKLPGPIFTITENFSSITALCFLINLKILPTSASLFSILDCNSLIKKLSFIFNPINLFLPVQLIIKKFFIIIYFIGFFNITNNLYSSEIIDDYGIITFMYHRFQENKYPSTNIKTEVFKQQLKLINDNQFTYIDPKKFKISLKENKNKKKILMTIDDAFLSFYKNAWPILKKNKIPFILFVSTKEVGKHNYMTWDQIKELAKEDFVHIGNHSHSHEYLIDYKNEDIKKDIETSIKIFKNKIGYESPFFSYPFGEYSLDFKKIVKELGFKYSFGQHSGVIDDTKDFLELPRFPINEKYGEIERFKTLLNTLPLKYKKITPEEKYINNSTNPPVVIIEFFENKKNLHLINCYSNEENKWRKSTIKFLEPNIIKIDLQGKFTTERGRINCSLREKNNSWRWMGIQFVVKEK